MPSSDEKMSFPRKFGLLVAAGVFFTLAGWGVREAENGQVGYTNDTSMWVFALGALLFYCAFVLALSHWWKRRRRRKGN